MLDKQHAAAFATKAKEKCAVAPFAKDANHAIITFGNDDEELPIPLVKNKGKWSFDTKVGREEILNRWIGTAELGRDYDLPRVRRSTRHEYAADKQ